MDDLGSASKRVSAHNLSGLWPPVSCAYCPASEARDVVAAFIAKRLVRLMTDTVSRHGLSPNAPVQNVVGQSKPRSTSHSTHDHSFVVSLRWSIEFARSRWGRPC